MIGFGMFREPLYQEPLYQEDQEEIRGKMHATDTTVRSIVTDRHAPSRTYATDAGVITQARDATKIRHLAFGDSVVETNLLPSHIKTTVNISALRSLASDHPDKKLCKYIIDGLTFGFKTGFIGPLTETRPKNNLSARNNEEKITKAIIKEVQRKHTSGPFDHPPIPRLHCSPIGSTEKPDGSARLVMDLSQPEGSSINEGIDREEFSVHYTHFDEATRMVRSAGRGSFRNAPR